LKVVLGVGNYSYGYGMAHVVDGLARELSTLGVETLVVSGRASIDTRIPVICCGYNEFLKHTHVSKVIAEVSKMNPDIFHSHYYPMDLCGAALSRSMVHVMHVHGILSRKYWQNLRVGLECFRSSIAERVGLMFSSKVVAVSRFLKRELMRMGLKSEDVNVIYPFIDPDFFRPIEKRIDEIPPSSESANILSVGTICERKGQHHLVEAMKFVTREDPNARLLFVGRTGQEDPSYLTRIKERIIHLRLENNVFFKGFIPVGALPSMYSSSDIFATGTMWEGFGLPVAEAMASSLPVVCFDTTSLSELVFDEVNGFKASPFDAESLAWKITTLVQDRKLRQKMGANGMKMAQAKFGRDNVRQLYKLYEVAMKKKT